MANRIKGITVEIGGDTTGLDKALKSVNSSITKTQSSLRDVNKLLKLDPSNTELLTQKQKLLKDAITSTKEKLDALKQAQVQAKEQLENGTLGQDKYDALQREIIETEQELRRLQEQAATTNTALAKIEEIGGKMESVGNSIAGAGKKMMGVTTVVGGLGVAAVKTAADFDSAMSQVAAVSGATGSDLEASLQKVEYGRNLTDVKINQDHTERVTALIPLGAKIMTTDAEGNEVETDERVTIEAVNDGKNYVYDEKAVKEIGWIWATEVWEDVTLPSNLLRKAAARIAELAKGITSMELTIVDESDTGADIADIHARQYVYCSSPPHGIDGRYLCIQRTRDYLNPSGNTVTIGASGITMTSITARQKGSLEALEQELHDQSEKMEDISKAKMYRIELVAEGTSIFRDKGQTSRLRCRVLSWDKDITSTLADSAFSWHRKSGNEEADADWDGLHKGMKAVTISTEDVLDNASFYCEVTI